MQNGRTRWRWFVRTPSHPPSTRPPPLALSGTSLNIHHSGCSESAVNAASHSRESLKPTLSSAPPLSIPLSLLLFLSHLLPSVSQRLTHPPGWWWRGAVGAHGPGHADKLALAPRRSRWRRWTDTRTCTATGSKQILFFFPFLSRVFLFLCACAPFPGCSRFERC